MKVDHLVADVVGESKGHRRADDRNSRRVAIVNESFARRFFAGTDAVGRKFSTGNGKEKDTTNLEIVGIVANTKYGNPREKQKELPDAVTKYLDCSKLMELHTHQKQLREKRVSLLRVIKPE